MTIANDIYLYDSGTRKEIISIIVTNNTHNITIYDYEKGILLSKVIDEQLSDNRFKRTINNVTLYIENENYVQIEISRKLESITYRNKTMIDRNKRLGTFDLETFKDRDGMNKVYAIGYMTLLDKYPNLFYILDHESNSELLILNCIDSLLISKYNNFTFYAHNGGRFDFIFIYNILLKYNEKRGFDYYKLSISTREDSILKLTISIKLKTNSKAIKISIVDSLNLLNASLDDLAKEFKSETQKTYFPYLFVSRNTLAYRGTTPAIEFYPKLNKEVEKDITIYNTLKKDI